MTESIVGIQDNIDLFKQLKKRPVIAWPTIILLAICHSFIFASWYGVINGELPLWAGCIINGVAMYFLFSPVHDASHNAVSIHYKVNTWVLAIAVQPILPFSTGKFLKMMHMMHHRFGNDPDKDPDYKVAHSAKGMFWTWFVWDFQYISFYKKNKLTNKMPDHDKRILRETSIVYLTVIIVACFYPMEVLFLWLIPSRIMTWLIAAVFMYLPHIPHNVTHEEDPYKATNNRYGLEFLLTPLLAYQNYHLVHHLYPTIPFYRYRKIWNARRIFHESHNPLTIKGLRLQPENSLSINR